MYHPRAVAGPYAKAKQNRQLVGKKRIYGVLDNQNFAELSGSHARYLKTSCMARDCALPRSCSVSADYARKVDHADGLWSVETGTG